MLCHPRKESVDSSELKYAEENILIKSVNKRFCTFVVEKSVESV